LTTTDPHFERQESRNTPWGFFLGAQPRISFCLGSQSGIVNWKDPFSEPAVLVKGIGHQRWLYISFNITEQVLEQSDMTHEDHEE
jgi:hypothetical protein